VLPTFNKLPERWTNPITGIGPDGNAVGAGGVMSPTGDLSTGDLTIGVVNGGSAVRSCPCYKIAIPTRQDSLLFTDVPYTDPQFSHTSSGPAPFVGLTVSEDERELWYTAPVQNHRAQYGCVLKRYSHATPPLVSVAVLPTSALTACTPPSGA